jgi:hypothetical protein
VFYSFMYIDKGRSAGRHINTLPVRQNNFPIRSGRTSLRVAIDCRVRIAQHNRYSVHLIYIYVIFYEQFSII